MHERVALPWMMMVMMMKHTYRMRPDRAGVYIIHLRRVFCRVDGFLIAPWLLGQVVEMVWVVSSQPEF